MTGCFAKIRCLTAAGLLLAAASSAAAQQGTGDLQGRVADPQGAAMPGVAVTARHQESGRPSPARTAAFS
jgi:hypothetical protein